jgi:hypothetical protein
LVLFLGFLLDRGEEKEEEKERQQTLATGGQSRPSRERRRRTAEAVSEYSRLWRVPRERERESLASRDRGAGGESAAAWRRGESWRER